MWVVRVPGRRRVGWAASAAQSYLTSWVGERVLTDLRVDLFEHVQRLDLGFFERTRAGVVISRLTNDVEALETLVTDGPTTLLQNTVTLIGSAAGAALPRLAAGAGHADRVPGDGDRHRAVPPLLVARLPAHPRAAGRGHRLAAGGHLGRPRRPGVPPRAGERAAVPRGERRLPRGQRADGQRQRRLLPVRRPAVGDGHGGGARVRRRAGDRRPDHDRRPVRVHRAALVLLRARCSSCRSSTRRSWRERRRWTRSSTCWIPIPG